MTKGKTKQNVIENKLAPPPVVTILGHVDHGKTTLLDYIRKSHVAEKEVGKITQRMSAYQVEEKGKKITFIDTPGHEAFSQMRARGAKVTDIVVLVIAADDGVMPQTKESIAHIKAAKAPFIVAINKIDLPGINIDKVKKQLAEEDVLVEGYGGDVVVVPVSAKTGKGVPELLEMIHLVAEVSEIKKDTEGEFEGVVIESNIDKFRGVVAIIMVKKGTLKVGDKVYGETSSGKLKSLVDSSGKKIKEATVSTPVEILGLDKVPAVGDVLSTKTREQRKEEQKKRDLDWTSKPKQSEINLIIKTDTAGSLEAVSNSIEAIKAEDQEVKFILKETGDINESDVLLAAATKAIIIGFNVKLQKPIEKIALEEEVNVRVYNLIYELLEELQEGLSALSESKKEKEIVGEAKILAVFETEEGKIAGGKITKGRINKSDTVEVKRGEKKIKETKIKSMKHKLSNINEAQEGEEFGIIFEDNVNFDKNDIIYAIKS